MTKPFDLGDLVLRLKSKGLAIAEAEAKVVAGEMFGWVEESLALEPNPLFKIGIPVIEMLKPMAMAAIDQIDGVKGN